MNKTRARAPGKGANKAVKSVKVGVNVADVSAVAVLVNPITNGFSGPRVSRWIAVITVGGGLCHGAFSDIITVEITRGHGHAAHLSVAIVVCIDIAKL